MTLKSFFNENKEALRGVEVILLSLICALFAEFSLASFAPSHSALAGIGRVVSVFIMLFFVLRFALISFGSVKLRNSDLITLNLILIGSIFLTSIGKIMGISIHNYIHSFQFLDGVSLVSFDFAIPFAAGALLLQAILGIRFGLVFGLCLALILSIYSPTSMITGPYVVVSVLVACISLLKFRSRSAYIRAGFHISLVGVIFAFLSVLLAQEMSIMDLIFRLGLAVLGGLLSSFIAAGITPIVEYLGGYVTDMRLIEMATLDHPLLKELSIQAPGTWNHSMVMGMMVESAADAIGANPVLARVSAYFHDIGKTKKPLYFVENQSGGENRHDKLSSSMSALIIRSHVKDGIDLAKKHKLPQPVEDMIPQHHGTSVIDYFFQKAKKEAEESGGAAEDVDKSLYTYPGPKPQTKEAGILMLADGIEAAARTLSDPSHDKIQGMVQKLINKVFSSGELNECELTLKDLHAIAKSFTRVLSGIYHQRIAYAEPAEKVSEKNSSKDSKEPEKLSDASSAKNEAEANQEKEGNGDKNKKAAESKKKEEDTSENLKRLGMS